MRAEKKDQDYTIYLSREEIMKLGERNGTYPLGNNGFEPLSVLVEKSGSEPNQERMNVMCTRSATVLWDARTHDNIYFKKDGLEILVMIYPPVLSQVLDRGFAVTRYDGHENKIWIRRDDSEKILKENQPESLKP
ncbi:MAG: hypothetical protein A3C27_00030 [Candidatus Levybacteria bacterium RIFCSPHIGHO2_02_FULL_39_36]|nr:MAG: hypothetical protein A3C27_00030 [Candidatus Levybacteria bacterium RIFCSPHIGHO2_02_FULL_39_36]OGH35981.1 MAG: hypothetical protein A3B43_00665 [Candidatus Levybacteria bacterium RIFCSPLOWO2_01_FULL_38_120]HLA03929.1 hypothetical protein [Patescibacteria group bacterium]